MRHAQSAELIVLAQGGPTSAFWGALLGKCVERVMSTLLGAHEWMGLNQRATQNYSPTLTLRHASARIMD